MPTLLAADELFGFLSDINICNFLLFGKKLYVLVLKANWQNQQEFRNNYEKHEDRQNFIWRVSKRNSLTAMQLCFFELTESSGMIA